MKPSIRSRQIRMLLLALPLLVAGCSARTASSSGMGMNQLSGEELAQYSTVMDAIQALRSNWLRPRSSAIVATSPSAGGQPTPVTQFNPVWVYQDGTRLGSTDVLSRISTSEVASVEYFDAASASARWGQNHENGVIHLTTR